jgi:hypothetical protein
MILVDRFASVRPSYAPTAIARAKSRIAGTISVTTSSPRVQLLRHNIQAAVL